MATRVKNVKVRGKIQKQSFEISTCLVFIDEERVIKYVSSYLDFTEKKEYIRSYYQLLISRNISDRLKNFSFNKNTRNSYNSNKRNLYI